MFSFGKLIKQLSLYLYPPRCPGCRNLLPVNSPDVLCPDCRKKWNDHKTELCGKCGQPMYLCWCNVPNNKEGKVDSERHIVQYRSDAHSMVFSLVHFMKYNYSDDVFNFTAKELSCCFPESLNSQEYVVVSVPRSRSSLRAAGHDQSYEIAKRFCALKDLQYADVLYHKGHKKQKKLNVKMRIENANKSYFIKNGSKSQLKDKTCILIDDVVTTGATVVRCAHLLKAKGAKKVIVLSIAKTVK